MMMMMVEWRRHLVEEETLNVYLVEAECKVMY